jgi:O-acetylserine/cysteine efflux transporter
MSVRDMVLLVSRVYDTRPSLVEVLAGASWLSLGAVLYLGAVATVWGYATWDRLLQRYPTAVIAPFALLAPCAGVVSSAIILREMFSPVRYAGMALILGGLAVIVLPGSRPPGPRPVRAVATPRHEEELDAS